MFILEIKSTRKGDCKDDSERNCSPPLKKYRVTEAMKAWKGYYCCVPLCRSSSGQNGKDWDYDQFHFIPSLI